MIKKICRKTAKKQLSASAIQVSEAWQQQTALENAKRSIQDGYGVSMMCDIADVDKADFVSGVSLQLYGTSVNKRNCVC